MEWLDENKLSSIILVSILIISTLIVTINGVNAENGSAPLQLTNNNSNDAFPFIYVILFLICVVLILLFKINKIQD